MSALRLNVSRRDELSRCLEADIAGDGTGGRGCATTGPSPEKAQGRQSEPIRDLNGELGLSSDVAGEVDTDLNALQSTVSNAAAMGVPLGVGASPVWLAISCLAPRHVTSSEARRIISLPSRSLASSRHRPLICAHKPRLPAWTTRRTAKGLRPVRADLRSVHCGLQHARFDRCNGASG
jgi:hypothetical protein